MKIQHISAREKSKKQKAYKRKVRLRRAKLMLLVAVIALFSATTVAMAQVLEPKKPEIVKIDERLMDFGVGIQEAPKPASAVSKTVTEVTEKVEYPSEIEFVPSKTMENVVEKVETSPKPESAPSKTDTDEKEKLEAPSEPVEPKPTAFSLANYTIVSKSNVQKEQLARVLERNGPNVLSENVDAYMAACEEFGVECGFLVAIGVHETGYGTSSLATKYNNISGMRCSDAEGFGIVDCIETKHGKFAVYDSIGNSMRHKAWLLKTYYADMGFLTIDQVWSKYAPLDDPKDISNLNENWGISVKEKLRRMDILK